MNAYTYAMTEDSVAALRQIVGSEASAVLTPEVATIVTGDQSVLIEAEEQDFESNFDCYRLTARITNIRPMAKSHQLGKVLRVEVLTGEEWIEAATGAQPPGFIGRVQAYQYSGAPGTAPREAVAKCLVEDAILVVGTHHELLVECDVMAEQLAWSMDSEDIGARVAAKATRSLAAG